MKKTIISTMLFAVLLLTGCASSENTSVYTAPNNAYSFEYDARYAQTQVDGVEVLMLSPLENQYDDFRESVNVVTEDSEGRSLSEYASALPKHIRQFNPGAVVLETVETTLGGQPAHEVTYVARQGELSLVWKQRFAIRDNTAYILTFTGEWDNKEMYEREVHNVFGSFTFH